MVDEIVKVNTQYAPEVRLAMWLGFGLPCKKKN